MRFPKTLVISALAAAAAGCASRAPQMQAQVQPDDEVRFVVWGDSQFANMEVFERMAHETNALRPDFVTQVGDLIGGYHHDLDRARDEWRRYKSQIEPLTMPFHPVPGNHDVVTPETRTVYGEVWGENSFTYSWDYGPVHCISLDTYRPGEGDRVAEAQREWLAKDLADYAAANGGEGSDELAKRSIFVLTHAPIWRYKEDTAGRKDWEEIHKLLVRYPVRIVFGGHTHEYVWENRDGIDYVVLVSSGGLGQSDNERGGMFHQQIHVSVENGSDVRAAVIRAGSVLPLDTVDSEERRAVPKYFLKGGTIRMPEWKTGAAIEKTFGIDVENVLDEPRVFRLEWQVPAGAESTKIEPADLWLEVPPKQTASPQFFLSTPSAPKEMPWLKITAVQKLRSGVVPRAWEKTYADRAEAAKADPSVITTNIELEREYTYTARHTLFVPPVASAVRREGEIALDGKLDDAAWQAAETVEFGEGNESATSVRILYDDEFLYVAAKMVEPHPEKLFARAAPPIAMTWSDDDFELYFDAQNTGRDYSRLFQNSVGTRFNSMPRHVENKYFESTYESGLFMATDHWALEMKIPYKEAGADKAPKAGDSWSINLGRNRQQSHPAQSSWAGGLYDPQKYGILRFE